jgi:glycosyltransferase involved in cell wall biosynthesis
MLKHNLVIRAPLYSRSGYGGHARDLLKALWDSNQFNLFAIPTQWGATSLTSNLSPEMLDILSFCIRNSIEVKDSIFMHIGIPNEFEKLGKYNIGVTAGLETETISEEWVKGCNLMDLVVVPSTFMERVFRSSGVRGDILVCPEGVNTDIFNKAAPPLELPQVATPFNFLSVGQWIHYDIHQDRKQIGYLIKQFVEIFRYTTDVGLIIKTFTFNTATPDSYFTLRRFKDTIGDDLEGVPPIYFLHGDMTDNELAGLYTNPLVKGFVTLTSGEGWGRSLAEAAACGVPIIAPDWSSYLDFLNPEVATLLPVKLVEIPYTVVAGYRGMFPRGARWAQVHPDTVSKALKKFYHDHSDCKQKALDYVPLFTERFSFKNSYMSLVQKLILISPGAINKPSNLRIIKT